MVVPRALHHGEAVAECDGVGHPGAKIPESRSVSCSCVSIFWRLLGFLRPYRAGATWSLVLAALAMVATVAIPWLTGQAIDGVQAGDEEQLRRLRALRRHRRARPPGVLRRAAGSSPAGSRSASSSTCATSMYKHLQGLELAFFDGQQTGQLMSRATVDLQSVRFFLGYGLVFFTQSGLTIVLAAVAMFLVEPGLAALSLLPVPFVVFVAARYGRRSRPALQEVQQRIAELTADVEENVSGVRVVKAFAAEPRQLERFEQSVARVFDQSMIATRLRAFYNPFIGFLPSVGLAVVLFVGGRQVIDGTPDAGRLHRLLHVPADADRADAHARLRARHGPAGDGLGRAAVPDPRPRAGGRRTAGCAAAAGGARAGRAAPTSRSPTRRPTRPRSRTSTSPSRPGTTVALVGGTGSGKTTLVQLLARLYDVDEGAVLVDGADVREVDLDALRGSISVVDDDPFLFSATVHENIAYGRPEATREEVEQAAERAQAAGFVAALPEGYDTRVGERGLTLSGGQRQRIAIARALLSDPRILVLDDATSSVDASTEQAIKQALREAMAGRTTFVIAHRLSTIALADEIVVLEHGRIAARGDARGAARDARELYAEIAEKGLPDQVFLNRDPRERVAEL